MSLFFTDLFFISDPFLRFTFFSQITYAYTVCLNKQSAWVVIYPRNWPGGSEVASPLWGPHNDTWAPLWETNVEAWTPLAFRKIALIVFHRLNTLFLKDCNSFVRLMQWRRETVSKLINCFTCLSIWKASAWLIFQLSTKVQVYMVAKSTHDWQQESVGSKW